jgi:N-formylglutamate deformylase
MEIQSPILISVPHSSTEFPEEVREYYPESVRRNPRDTDWHVDKLYGFCAEIGIEVVVAPYSRYVIDLNRDPGSQALYDDGRVETSLIPSKSFEGEEILIKPIPREEVDRRKEEYFWSYYQNLREKLDQRVEKFGQALLFDAHSIKRNVKSIQSEPFPDLILGDADEESASALIIDGALNALGTGPYKVNHNHPFKGGHITRYFGQISDDIHALQLEMSQDIYMNEETNEYEPEKAQKVQEVLKTLFNELKVLLQ